MSRAWRVGWYSLGVWLRSDFHAASGDGYPQRHEASFVGEPSSGGADHHSSVRSYRARKVRLRRRRSRMIATQSATTALPADVSA